MILKSLSEKHTQPHLDGLRGLAALMVLAHHAILYIETPFASPFVRASLDSGHHGVSLFFILSAYTLSWSWTSRQANEHKPIRSFYIRRAFRILPFWWLNVLYVQWMFPRELPPLFANIFLLFPWIPFDSNYLMVPYGWSIGVEETFYILFPLWMIFCRRISALIFLLIAFIWISESWLKAYPLLFPNNNLHEFYFTFPPSRYFTFFIGLLVFHVTQKHSLLTVFDRTPRILFWGIELLALAMVFQMQHLTHLQATFLMGFLLLISTHPRGVFHRFLNWKPIGQIGICCYSFYLLHFYTLEGTKSLQVHYASFFQALSGEWEFIFVFLSVTLATFGVSALSFLLVERPSVLAGRRFLQWLNTRDLSLESSLKLSHVEKENPAPP